MERLKLVLESNIAYQEGLVSFCCLGYNHSKYIKACIESIWRQKYDNIEIVALDDGSKDGSYELLLELKKKSPFEMKVLGQKNTGNIPKNFNTLIENSRGEFLYFTSLDDMARDDTIETKILCFDNDSNLVFVANKCHCQFAQDGTPSETIHYHVDWSKLSINTSKDLLEAEFQTIGLFYIQGTLFRREIVDTVGGFDDDLLGDDIILRTKIFKHMSQNPELTYKFLDSPGMYYRMHSSNIHANSLRQIKLVKEWKDRFFPERPIQQLFIKWIEHSLSQALTSKNLKNYSELICMLDDLLENETQERRNTIIESIIIQNHVIQHKDHVIQEKIDEIQLMKASQFWKLRTLYHKIRHPMRSRNTMS